MFLKLNLLKLALLLVLVNNYHVTFKIKVNGNHRMKILIKTSNINKRILDKFA